MRFPQEEVERRELAEAEVDALKERLETELERLGEHHRAMGGGQQKVFYFIHGSES